MPLPHKNSGNEYFVLTEPNAALTDTARGWLNLWGKQDSKQQHTEPEPQQSELAEEMQQLREENNDLISKNQKLSIHIYYLLKAAEARNQDQAILNRSSRMKTEFLEEYADEVAMQEIKKLNDFMKNPQFDDADQMIQYRVLYPR